MMSEAFVDALRAYAGDLTDRFAVQADFEREDQLKEPVSGLLRALGSLLSLEVEPVTEVHAGTAVGRPDIGVSVASLLTGHVELKAPGKGASPEKFTGHDREQWKRFQDLPNLVYTDGSEWTLYRGGERVGKLVRLAGDATTDGARAVRTGDAEELFGLLRDFMYWEPITPSNPRQLAHMLAPVCRMLRSQVLDALQRPESALSLLAADWRQYLFPDADDQQFADAYAQTFTYALLLARFSGAVETSATDAASAIRGGHRLLADALRIMSVEDARQEISTAADLLQRLIAAVDPASLTQKDGQDPWLYFYEDFLAAYDPAMRKARGVYYTPVQVVQAQVRLVHQLLTERLGAQYGFVDPEVVTLDPAVGTGTYILAAIQHGLENVGRYYGPGMRASFATTAAKNVHGFEILVGPYTVAHLRLTQQILAEQGSVPDGGVHIYLTDSLESPNAEPPPFPFAYRTIGEEYRRAQQVKAETPVLVCIGNPPYDRQQGLTEGVTRKGGWVRYGDTKSRERPILEDFLTPLEAYDAGKHAKNLYNDYVYFWRWALWKVFESKEGPGIVSFITASSYLRGPGFAGMREVMRRTFDDLWIIDLEGDSLGARKTENVFAIRTPVAIAIGVREDAPNPNTPARVRYTRLAGTQADKLSVLGAVERFEDLAWRDCLQGWGEPLLPTSSKPYWDWPLLTALFPWQENGMQFKRTWPIGESVDLLQKRWRHLVMLPSRLRRHALRETAARKASGAYLSIDTTGVVLPSLSSLPPTSMPETVKQYSYRSFDRQWVVLDNRLCDRPRPGLQRAYGSHQVYLTSLLTKVLGEGPAAVVTHLLPDLDVFCNRGGRDVIPLWRDAAGTEPNVATGLLPSLAARYGRTVGAEDLLAYCYALMATPRYVERFWEELTIPGPRIPLTKDADLFARAAALGRRLIWLHTYGERMAPEDQAAGHVPQGVARCKVGTPAAPEDYPESFGYDAGRQELCVGKGVFSHVRPEVWDYSVSGLEVVKSWLGYRMRKRAGRKSSPLDDIRPQSWHFDGELLELLWVLDATVDLLPECAALLDEVLEGDLFREDELPQPTAEDRAGPKAAPIFGNYDVEDENEDEEA